MAITLAHLGPQGTYAEAAASLCAQWWYQQGLGSLVLKPYPSIAQTLQAAASGEAELAIIPVENSTEGSVTVTLDTLWKVDLLRVRQAWVLPISHSLLSRVSAGDIEVIYSHPQALAQCQQQIEARLPHVPQVPTNSTAEAIQRLDEHPAAGAIASRRAAELYQMPIAIEQINDYPDNCTRFWVVSQPRRIYPRTKPCSHTSLAFSLSANQPGALVKALNIFAERTINLSRIESRPTKRSLGEYLFFLDVEANADEEAVQDALQALGEVTETLKLFGSYSIWLASEV
ncbi:MAG: prephenate dehydratase [Elainellaceae cyanobacterium]